MAVLKWSPSDGVNNLSTLANWLNSDNSPASALPDATTTVQNPAGADVKLGTCTCLSFDGNGGVWTGGTITAPADGVRSFLTVNGGICTNRYDASDGTSSIVNINALGGIKFSASTVYSNDQLNTAVAAQLTTDIAAVDAGKSSIKTTATILTIIGTYLVLPAPARGVIDPANPPGV